LNEKRAISAEMAVRIAKVIGGSPESWLHMQDAVDIWEVEQKYKKSPAIAPFAFEALIASA
jgi:plasmid maintenance system antidote protein VapI